MTKDDKRIYGADFPVEGYPDPLRLVVLDGPPDPSEGAAIDAEDTLHRCLDVIEAGTSAETVAQALLDALTDDQLAEAREIVNGGAWDDIAPHRPAGRLMLALNAVDSHGWNAMFEMQGVAAVVRERDEALQVLRAFRDGGPGGGQNFAEWHPSYAEAVKMARKLLGEG